MPLSRLELASPPRLNKLKFFFFVTLSVQISLSDMRDHEKMTLFLDSQPVHLNSSGPKVVKKCHAHLN